MTKIINKLHRFFRRNKYDEINIVNQGGTDITYGIIHGNNTIVFIKTGMKGSIYGYQNKYLKISKELNNNHNCTVIVSSNPNGLYDDFENEMKSLKAYAYYHKWSDYQIYYMGHSIGATLGIVNAHKYPEIKKLLCINAPLNINSHLLTDEIQKFSGEKITMIYGSKDPDCNMIKLFSKLKSDNTDFTIIQGVDHNFTGYLKLFMALPGFFFFGDKLDCNDVKLLKNN